MIAMQEALLGQTIAFEGYAYDYGRRIVAMQFSLDGGASWATFDTSDASSDLWVHWTYALTPERAGMYQLRARSVNEDGKAGPSAAVASFVVN